MTALHAQRIAQRHAGSATTPGNLAIRRRTGYSPAVLRTENAAAMMSPTQPALRGPPYQSPQCLRISAERPVELIGCEEFGPDALDRGQKEHEVDSRTHLRRNALRLG